MDALSLSFLRLVSVFLRVTSTSAASSWMRRFMQALIKVEIMRTGEEERRILTSTGVPELPA
ncbi:hypothetical protein WN944_019494 [Citrus x changshan-huyou]|uniref:Secreted protein n=1 Tax=Citrus x changshan-huyou TaxID=2935761 RepID=A0AAP0LYP9_9ROSI